MSKKIYLIAALSILITIFSGGSTQQAEAAVSCEYNQQNDVLSCGGSVRASSSDTNAENCRSTCGAFFTNYAIPGQCWIFQSPNNCRCFDGSVTRGGSNAGGSCTGSGGAGTGGTGTGGGGTSGGGTGGSGSGSSGGTGSSGSSGSGASGYIPNPIGTDSLNKLIGNITVWLYIFSIPILSLLLLYGAFLMITSQGEEEKYNKGKKVLKWGVLGFLLVLFSGAIATIIRAVIA